MTKQDWEIVPDGGWPGWNASIDAMWRYLRTRRPAGPPFRRADFDPIDVPRLLPYVWLFDVLRDPPDFRYRLIGTNIVESMGADHTGKKLSEVYPDMRNTIGPVLERLEFTVASGKATWRRGMAIASRLETRDTIENLMLPFVGDDGAVEMVFGLSVIYRADGREF